MLTRASLVTAGIVHVDFRQRAQGGAAAHVAGEPVQCGAAVPAEDQRRPATGVRPRMCHHRTQR